MWGCTIFPDETLLSSLEESLGTRLIIEWHKCVSIDILVQACTCARHVHVACARHVHVACARRVYVHVREFCNLLYISKKSFQPTSWIVRHGPINYAGCLQKHSMWVWLCRWWLDLAQNRNENIYLIGNEMVITCTRIHLLHSYEILKEMSQSSCVCKWLLCICIYLQPMSWGTVCFNNLNAWGYWRQQSTQSTEYICSHEEN